jgi:hypothetical protein
MNLEKWKYNRIFGFDALLINVPVCHTLQNTTRVVIVMVYGKWVPYTKMWVLGNVHFVNRGVVGIVAAWSAPSVTSRFAAIVILLNVMGAKRRVVMIVIWLTVQNAKHHFANIVNSLIW